MLNPVLVSSARTGDGTNEWGTPKADFDYFNAKYGPFKLDVCARLSNTKCSLFYDVTQVDGLQRDWAVDAKLAGGGCWMNPPYSPAESKCNTGCDNKRCSKRGFHNKHYRPGIEDWVSVARYTGYKVPVGCLLPSRTGSYWFHTFVLPIIERCSPGVVEFIRGRIKFEGSAKVGAPFDSLFVLFRP
jgi:DNA N-6-adenine-methyltransferase (Dam)